MKSIHTITLALLASFTSISSAAPSSLSVNYQKYRNGQTYSRSNFESDIRNVYRYGNIGDGNQKIAIQPSNSRYKRLRVQFKKGEFGGKQLTGVHGKLAPNNKYTLKYSVRFLNDFDFSKGGKLPGIGGGSVPAGGNQRPDGMSARIMWLRNRGPSRRAEIRDSFVAYHYYLGRYRDYKNGDDPKLAAGETTWLQDIDRNRWYNLGIQVKLNKGDGIGRLTIKINGKIRYNSEHRYLTGRQNWKMNRLMHVFFYGGGSPVWAPDKNTALLFDNLNVTRDNL